MYKPAVETNFPMQISKKIMESHSTRNLVFKNDSLNNSQTAETFRKTLNFDYKPMNKKM